MPIGNIFKKGDRIKVFDPSLFIDDIKTPLSTTMQNCTVLKFYTTKDNRHYLVDVRFDYNNKISCCHFTNLVYRI